MSLKTTNLKSWTIYKFMIAVLWMEGRLGPSEIARAVRWTPGQVRGFVTREFEPARVYMTREARQEILTALKEWTEYFDVFVDQRFADRFFAKELRGEVMARKNAIAAVDTDAEPQELTKKDLKRMESEEAARTRKLEQSKLQRESGFAPRGTDLDALAWLYNNALGDKNEAVPRGGLMSRDRRKEAALKFCLHLAGRSISPLQAQDLETIGAGGEKIALPEYRKFCMDIITGIRALMPPNLFQMIEVIVEKDEFVWLLKPQGSQRGVIYESVRYATDILAVFYQMMSRDDFEARWKEKLPFPMRPEEGPDGAVTWVAIDQPSRASARADSERAQNIIDQLKRAVA